MSQPLNSRPFAFDTEFDASGVVVAASSFRPAKRSYSPAEVDALVAQARTEARETALAESTGLQAMALSTVAQCVAESAAALAAVSEAHRAQSAQLALTCARIVAAAALDRLPSGALTAALEALGQEIDASPRLVVRMAGLNDDSRAAIERQCADAGFTGLVAFRDEPGHPAAFQLEWSDGRADFAPDDAFARMSAALTAALAAEAGHAENMNEPGTV
jgi:flagellar assembly protein FliH